MDSAGDERALLCIDATPSPLAFEAASPAMRAFGHMLADAARYDVPVLLVGESGTGKKTFARALHAMSARAAGPFVRVDCSLGAVALAEIAAGARSGTLFLDEVAELSPAGQASALKLLADAPHAAAPVRFVAGTHHDLDVEVRGGRFRPDLFYRLDILEIRVPPLRERREEILPLTHAFVDALARKADRAPPALAPELERALLAYAWPGNVRELLSVLERLVLLMPGPALDASALPARIAEGGR